MTDPTTRAASKTALGVAIMRAAHRWVDQAPWLLDDPVTEQLLDPAQVPVMRAGADRFREPGVVGLRTHVLLRSRIAEDELAAAVRRGVRRLVVLGAGLDTFAWRQPAWANHLEIFEVDHPASQADKQQRLARAGFSAPDNLRWASTDFEHESLAHGLERNGVDLNAPIFVSMLGVSMYLTPDDVTRTLQAIGAYPPGTTLVMTFSAANDNVEGAQSDLAVRAAEMGEPWRSAYTIEMLDSDLAAAGFTRRWFPTVAELAHYFDGRSDLPVPRRISVVIATV